ncbi:MAG: hypothetical protein ACT4OU_07620 [Hyphomicrobium sp.]
MPAAHNSGAVSASLIILVLVAAAIGALAAIIFEGLLPPGNRLLAILAGFLAVVIASIARYKLVFLGAGTGPDESKVPMVLVVNAAIASVAGSLAAHDLWNLGGLSGAGVLGAIAGLLSAVLMAMLMITYHTNSQSA